MNRPILFRHALYVLMFLLAVSLYGANADDRGQSGSQGDVPLFRSKSQLVLVPVVVKDHQGKHISGLGKQDFVLKQDGLTRKISICEEVNTSARPVEHPQNKRNDSSVSNIQEEQTPRRIVIVALDSINTGAAVQADTRRRLLESFGSLLNDRALVSLVMIRRGGLKVIHDFTTDPAVLAAALRKFRGLAPDVNSADAIPVQEAAQVDSEADDIALFADDVEANSAAEQKRVAILSTMDALNEIAQRYAGIPGKKSLIWVTSGFPFSISDSGSFTPRQSAISSGLDDIQPEYERMWTLLNAANIAVYPLDVRGLDNPVAMDATVGKPARDAATRQIIQHQDSLDTFRSFAEMTGGKAYFNTNDLARSLRDAVEDSSSYYMLGYYLGDEKPGWHRLKVSVEHHGASARARDGFFVETSKPKSDSAELARALASPLDFTAVALTLRWNARVRASQGAKTIMTFDVEWPGSAVEINDSDNNHVSVDVLAVAKQPNGNVEADSAKKIDSHLSAETAAKVHERGMKFSESLQLAKGDYTIRVVVRDNLTGRIGSVSAPVEIE